MKRAFVKLGWFGVLALLFASFSVAVNASEITMKSRRLIYEDGLRQIEAIGEVEVIYQDFRINAKRALLDQELQTLSAMGQVDVYRGNELFWGEELYYDFRTRQGRLVAVQTGLTASVLDDVIHLQAEEAFFEDDVIRFRNVSMTSCHLDISHYHLTVERMEYYPAEQLILHKVWYWEGQLKLVYFPYLVISLKEANTPFEVRIGQDWESGWFLYIGYGYYLNTRNHGMIYTEVTEWNGDGLGIRNITEISGKSRWYQDFFYRDNRDNDKHFAKYKLALGYETQAHSKLSWSTNFENGYQTDWGGRTYSELRFTLKGVTPYPSLFWKYRYDAGETETIHALGNWNYQTSRRWDLHGGGEWYHQDYLDVWDDELINNYNYTIRTNLNQDWGNLGIRLTNHLGSHTYSSNYLPEIIFNIFKWDLPGLGQVSYRGQYSNYQTLYTEDNRIIQRWQGQRLANDVAKHITLWQKDAFQLTGSSKLQQRYYWVDKTSSQFYGFTGGFDLTKQIGQALMVSLGLEYTETGGEPESHFPENDHFITRGGALTNGWIWNKQTLNASLYTGYNFTLDEPKPFQMRLSWMPNSISEVSLTTVAYCQDTFYYNKGFGMTQLDIRYLPKEHFRLNLGMCYDFQTDYWGERYGEAFINQPFRGNWRGELAARYSDVVGDFSLLQLGVVYMWDCREIYFKFDDLESRYWLQLHFKIFPRLNVGWGSEGPGFIYDG